MADEPICQLIINPRELTRHEVEAMQYSNRRFSSEEVGAIVRRALESQGGLDDISYEDFEEIARQSGISEGRLRQAIEDEERLGEFERAKETWLARKKSAFFKHLRAYCIVNGFLFLINILTNPGYLWVVWPILGWGISLAFGVSETFFPSEHKVERGAQRVLQRREKAALGSWTQRLE